MGFKWLERKLIVAFDGYGRLVCRHPAPFLIIPIIYSILVAGGLLLIKLEVGIVMLFTPVNAPSRFEQIVARDFISVHPKPENLNATAIDRLPYDGERKFTDVWFNVQIAFKDQRNLMTPEPWLNLSQLMRFIYHNFTCSISDHPDSPRLRYNPDFCNPDRGCLHMEDYVTRIADVLNSSFYSTRMADRFRLSYPILYVFRKPFNWGQLLYGVKVNETSGILESARVLSLFFQFQYPKKQVNMAVYAQRCMQEMADYMISLNNQSFADGLQFHPLSERIMDNQVMLAKYYTLPYLAVTIGLILLFTIGSSLERAAILSSAFESSMGVFTIGLSLLASFGTIFICGRYFNTIVTVTPFLAMCVGIDNDFLIMAAYRQTNRKWKTEKRLGAAFASAGPSLTITSITDILCFGVGFISDTPSVANFCLYTSVSLAFRYIYQLTFFAAIMAYVGKFETEVEANADGRSLVYFREIFKKHLMDKTGKVDSVKSSVNGTVVLHRPVSPSNENHESNEHAAHKFFQNYYAPFLMMKPIRLMIMVFYVIYLSFVLYFACQMRVDISPQKLIVDDSSLTEYFSVAERYSWSDSVLAHVFILKPPDFRNKSEIDKFLEFADKIGNITEFVDPTASLIDTQGLWLRDYLGYLDYVAQMNDNYNKDFYDYIAEFLNTPDYYKYWYDIRFKPRLNESSPLEVIRFRFMSFYRNVSTWEKHVKLLEYWRRVASEHRQYKAYIYDHHHLNIYLDQRRTLERTTLQTSGIAILSMALITAIFMPDIASVFYICLSFLSVDIGVVGFLKLWDTDLDPVTMVCVLMTIGFSVYYTARICYYYRTLDPTLPPYQKVRLTLGAVGWPITQGGSATLLGIFPFAFVRVHMVRVFFRTITLLVLIGLFHGLLVMPVVMSSFDQWRPARRKVYLGKMNGRKKTEKET